MEPAHDHLTLFYLRSSGWKNCMPVEIVDGKQGKESLNTGDHHPPSLNMWLDLQSLKTRHLVDLKMDTADFLCCPSDVNY
jgi:hypothetical protein